MSSLESIQVQREISLAEYSEPARKRVDGSDGRLRVSATNWGALSELQLSFSEGRTKHPIERAGNHPPTMPLSGLLANYGDDPECQWFDSWPITDELRAAEICWYISQFVHIVQLDWNLMKAQLHYLQSTLRGDIRVFFQQLVKFARQASVARSTTRIRIKQWPADSLSIGTATLPISGVSFPFSDSLRTLTTLHEAGDLRFSEMVQKELLKWSLLIYHRVNQPSHLSTFDNSEYASGRRIVGYQGVGDLSFNPGYAFVGPRVACAAPDSIVLPQDEVDGRELVALVRFNRPVHGRLYEICYVRFGGRFGRVPAHHIERYDTSRREYCRDDNISFALAGKPIMIKRREHFTTWLRDGRFGDLRHFYQLPNLNPPEHLKPPRFPGRRPRLLFDRLQTHDIWLGEYALLRDADRRALAYCHQLGFSCHELGASREQIRAALEWDADAAQCYDERSRDSLRPGEFRERVEQGEPVFDIHFRENHYPTSVLGVTRDGNLLSFAWQGPYSDPTAGFTLRELVPLLSHWEVESAIILEEGRDSFLSVGADAGLPVNRRVRPAVLIFTVPKF